MEMLQLRHKTTRKIALTISLFQQHEPQMCFAFCLSEVFPRQWARKFECNSAFLAKWKMMKEFSRFKCFKIHKFLPSEEGRAANCWAHKHHHQNVFTHPTTPASLYSLHSPSKQAPATAFSNLTSYETIIIFWKSFSRPLVWIRRARNC